MGLCTICADPGLLFSHRRDGAHAGRQGALAWSS
ncbi:MAG: laccase domain-containing protein [Solirubrobacteraceae bacterium]